MLRLPTANCNENDNNAMKPKTSALEQGADVPHRQVSMFAAKLNITGEVILTQMASLSNTRAKFWTSLRLELALVMAVDLVGVFQVGRII